MFDQNYALTFDMFGWNKFLSVNNSYAQVCTDGMCFGMIIQFGILKKFGKNDTFVRFICKHIDEFIATPTCENI